VIRPSGGAGYLAENFGSSPKIPERVGIESRINQKRVAAFGIQCLAHVGCLPVKFTLGGNGKQVHAFLGCLFVIGRSKKERFADLR
jgi:hypothetical protein